MTARGPSILYMVHDLADAAVGRRVAMMRAGGARVHVAGFARSGGTGSPGERALVLGQAQEGRMARRVLDVLRAAAKVRPSLSRVERQVEGFDVVIARNLEMLALARRAGLDAPIVYECLDIHRLMLRSDALGRSLRGLERRLCRGAGLLLTSSPAFVREHFAPAGIDLPVRLVENRVFGIAVPEPRRWDERNKGTDSIKIGWFGALRCRRSLEALATFTRAQEGRFTIVLRGRPAPGVLDDLPRLVRDEPFMRFEGPYTYPTDLERIYGECDLSWAVDFYEEGQNSDWLLPNRLYEASAFGVPSIAMESTETGRYLDACDLGIRLSALDPSALDRELGSLDRAQIGRLRKDLAARPRSLWVCDESEARRIVNDIINLRTASQIFDKFATGEVVS